MVKEFVPNTVAVIGNIIMKDMFQTTIIICNIPPSIYTYWQMIVVFLCS